MKEAEKKNEQSLSSQISVTSSSTEDILEEVKEVEKKNEDLENRMKSMEATLKKLQHLAEIEGDITKVGRDITSARADTKRMEGRVIKASEEITRIKTDLGHMGKEGRARCNRLIIINYLTLFIPPLPPPITCVKLYSIHKQYSSKLCMFIKYVSL